MISPPRPPPPSFRLVRYFIVASLAVFLPVAATLLYFDLRKNDFFKQVQRNREALFARMQDGFLERHDSAAPAYLLKVHEAGNVNLGRLFANTLWEKDVAPLVARAQSIPVDRCRAIADVKDAGGRTVQPREKEACYTEIGRQIMALPEFRALDAKVFETVKKSTVLKIKVCDLRGITVYSSEHDQVGADYLGNVGWQSAVAGKPASQLTHRGKFSAFEGEVSDRDLISSYLPVMAHGSAEPVAVFEVYSDVTQFLEQIDTTAAQIRKLGAENRALLEGAAAANRDKVDARENLMRAIVLGLFALLYCALFVIVRNGQRIIDKQDLERERMIGALRESEEEFRAIFESVVDGILIVDAGTAKFLIGNPAICRMLGYTPEEVGRLGIPDIHPEQDLPHVMEQFERQRRGESEIATDIPVTRRDGSVFYADIKSAPIRLGGKDCLLGVFRDVTERKAMDAKLRDSIAFRELLLQAIPLPVFHKDALGRYTGCNRAFTEFIGKSENDIVGKTVYEVSPQSFAQAYRDKDLELLDGPVGMQVYESRVMHADGTAHDVIFHKARIVDNAGRPTGIVGAITDITGNRRAQEALRESEERFRGLVEQSIAGIYIIQDGKFAYVNPRFAQIRGYSAAEEMIGLDPLPLIAEKDRGTVAENIRRLLAGDIPSVDYSFVALRKDGTSVEVGVHSALATYRGRPAIIGLMQDISEKKRAEEQIQHYVTQLENAFMQSVEVATILSEMRDPYTAGHERRVAEIAVAIGAELGFDARRQEGLRVAGYLHDIGKIAVPAEILAKPTKLTPLEYELIKGHAQASHDVLKNVEFPWPVAEIALQHHERMDGSGYPQGLKGEAILLEARILAVADVIEAMSSHRPYRPGLGIEAALAEIERGRGTAYDANVADTCLRLFREKGYAIPA